MRAKLDAADRRILSVLQEDGSLSVAQVGERIHLSTNACWRRIKRLEEEGVVLRRVALLDPAKLGLTVVGYVAVSLSDHDTHARQRFVDAGTRHRNILELSAISGDMDFLLKVSATDLSAFEQIVADLATEHNLAQIRSDIVLRPYRMTTVLPLE